MSVLAVKVEPVYPPIPTRNFDWMACIEGNEEDGPYGRGPTEDAAIEDLIEQVFELGQ
jgi:hypothetical protein